MVTTTSGLFSSLEIQGWRQFDYVKLDLHPRLTILTGANGCGKTTLLNLFSRHFGFQTPILATPKLSASGTVSYALDLFKSVTKRWWNVDNSTVPPVNQIGAIVYSSGSKSPIHVPPETSAQYQLSFGSQQAVYGVTIASHRPISNYQPVANIPVNAMTPSTAYSSYFDEMRNRLHGGHTGYSPVYRMKEALISMATFGPGNSRIQRNVEADQALLGFEQVLRKVLPKTLGFRGILVRQTDIVLNTETGEFLLDAASGGVMALIDICWQIHLYSLNHGKFVVTMDEPENHLHPSMQRSLMSDLLSAFPNAQFIVATHSPFVVSSTRDSTVYALRYFLDETKSITERRRIYSERLNLAEKAGTAAEVLREVLGVPVTAPEWVEDELNSIVKRYSQGAIDKGKLEQLEKELKEAGLSEYFSDALAGLAKPNDISAQIR